MSKDQQRLIDYLKHILEACSRIQDYIEDIDEVSFLTNGLIQDAVIRNLEVIGEASRNVGKYYPEYIEQHTEVPFLIAYGYFKVDLDIVWKTIERDLPELQVMVESLLNDKK